MRRQRAAPLKRTGGRVPVSHARPLRAAEQTSADDNSGGKHERGEHLGVAGGQRAIDQRGREAGPADKGQQQQRRRRVRCMERRSRHCGQATQDCAPPPVSVCTALQG